MVVRHLAIRKALALEAPDCLVDIAGLSTEMGLNPRPLESQSCSTPSALPALDSTAGGRGTPLRRSILPPDARVPPGSMQEARKPVAWEAVGSIIAAGREAKRETLDVDR